jgi:hypothetical protein
VKALEAATLARQQREKEQKQKKQQLEQQLSLNAAQTAAQEQQDQQWVDAVMEDVTEEAVLEALSQLRGDQQYLDELTRAIDMDWEATASPPGSPSSRAAAQAPPATTHALRAAAVHAPGAAGAAGAAAGAPGASGLSAVDLAMLSAGGHLTAEMDTAGAVSAHKTTLILVLDTNVLLEKKLLHFLHALQLMQQQQGGALKVQLAPGQQQVPGSSWTDSRGQAALQVQVVVPWTVLVELDKLKLSECALTSMLAARLTPLANSVGCCVPHISCKQRCLHGACPLAGVAVQNVVD